MDAPPSPAAARFLPLASARSVATLVLPTPTAPSAQPELPLAGGTADAPVGPAEGTAAARQVATAITVALVEVIAGRRALGQLDGRVEADVLRLVERLRFRYTGRDLRLCSLRLQFPVPTEVEACARLSLDGLGRAAALRISQFSGGWWVTSLTAALPAGVVSRAGRC